MDSYNIDSDCSAFTVSEEVRESWEEVCVPSDPLHDNENKSKTFVRQREQNLKT